MATVEQPLSQPRTGDTGGKPDAAQPVYKQPKPIFLRSWFAIVLTVLLVAAHVYGWQKSEIDLGKLVEKRDNIGQFIGRILQPDIIGYDQKGLQTTLLQVVGSLTPVEQTQPVEISEQLEAALQSANPQTDLEPIADPSGTETYNVTARASANTVTPGQKITVSASGLRPNSEGNIIWRSTGTNAATQPLGTFKTDANGTFTAEVQVPEDPERVINTYSYPNTIAINQSWNVGGPQLTDTFWTVLDKIIETIFLALMGTTFAVILSIPLSFLASRNLMAHNLVGNTVYGVARTILNVLRSIEVLILAVIFGATVGLGPFAGVLALTLHSIASLGKLYSEAIESIDPGPIEAISATGANRIQMIVYAVVPQFIPQFMSFTLYRWDINVRMSTVLGFVGGGGIGYILQSYIQLLEWNKAGTAILFIAIVVIAMDFASAKIRAAVL